MFSNLTQNSVIYIMDLNNSPKITSGLVESISLPRPKYNGFNPTFETVVDIVANIAGERREFKGVPNNAVADFGEAAFILAENKEVLGSYINSMLQNKINTQGDIITQLRNQISNDKQTEAFTAAFHAIDDKVDAIAAKIPNTVPITWPNLTAVNNTPYAGGYGNWGYNGFGGSIIF